MKYHVLIFLSLLIQPMIFLGQPGRSAPAEMMQQKRMDSLLSLIKGSPDDSLKVQRLLLVSRLQFDPAKTRADYAIQALSIAEKTGYKTGIMLANSEAGAVYQVLNNYPTAIQYYKKAILLSEEDNAGHAASNFYPALLNLYFYLGDYPKAMETISREKTIAEKTNDQKRIAHCENILGYIYFKQENFGESEQYYHRYISIALALHDSLMLAHAYGEIADVYTAEKKFPEAIDVLNRIIQICDILPAKPGKLDTNFVNAWSPQYKGKAFYRLGKVYKLLGEYDSARLYALKALDYSEKTSPPKYDIAGYYISAGDIFNKIRSYSKAIEFLQYGYALSREIQHRENIRDAAGYLAQTYASLEKYDSAYYFFSIYTGLKDSIVNNETKMMIA
ncbi:MAG TPA: tetratricopeptide repeat protein, partial [Ferruginibacter sp.]|nr:tetratricopeptide repeat protein [Ferruginibacter sp.]